MAFVRYKRRDWRMDDDLYPIEFMEYFLIRSIVPGEVSC